MALSAADMAARANNIINPATGLSANQANQGYTINKSTGAVMSPGMQPTQIPNVSPSVSSAVNNSGLYNPNAPINNNTISGSPSVIQNMSTNSSLTTASNSLTTTPPANYTPLANGATPTFGTQGQNVSDLQTNLNTQAQSLGLKVQPLKVDGKYGPQTQAMAQAIANASTGGGTKDAPTGPTTDPKTGNITYPNGKIIDSKGNTVYDPAKTDNTPTPVSVQTDSTGGITTTYSNGTTLYTPPAPEVAAAYTQANAATNTENATYENAVATAKMQLQEQSDQNNQDKANAMSAAEMSYDTNNPEGSGSDKAQYMSSISAKFDKANNVLTENAMANLTQLSIAHNASLQNIQGQLSTAVMTSKANIQATATSSFKDYIAGLKSGDGTMPSGPEIMDAIQTAMTAGKTFEQAKSEIGGALAYAARVQQKADTAESHTAFMEQHTLATEQHAINMENLAQERIDQAINGKQGYDKATVSEQVGVERFVNDSKSGLTSADWEKAKSDPDYFNYLMSEAINAGNFIQTSLPVDTTQ